MRILRKEKIRMTENLLDMETLVFDIVQDYLDGNRPFHMEDVIPFLQNSLSNSSIDLNNEGLRKILLSLVKKKLIVEGSILSRENVFENATRKKIYDFILTNSGVLFNQIRNELDISNYVVYWHLKILLRFELIQQEFIDNHHVFFDGNLDQDELKRFYLTSKKISVKLIEYLVSNDYGVTKNRIASDLKLHQSTVDKYLGLLEEVDVVISEKYSSNNLYFLKELQE